MKKNYRKLYEELQSKIDVDNKIKQHKKNYIHIPFSWKRVGLFFVFLGSLGLTIFNFFILIANWKVLKLGDLTKETIKGFYKLGIVPQIIFEYCLISLAVICLVALIKGGFDKLKPKDDEGLINNLIVSLIFGLIGGLIGGLIVGLISGLTGGLIFGLIGGLIFSLTGSLIGSLIFGLSEEFK